VLPRRYPLPLYPGDRPEVEEGRRRVPIVGSLRRDLLEHKARTGRRDDDLVFGSKPDHPFTPTNIRKRALHAWKVANAKRAEQGLALLVPIGLHELRHTYVSLMHDAGFSLERIGDYVGHSSAYMTDRYRHLLDGHEADTAKRFEEYLTTATRTS